MVSTRSSGKKASQNSAPNNNDEVEISQPAPKRRRTQKASQEDLEPIKADHNEVEKIRSLKDATTEDIIPVSTSLPINTRKLIRFDSEEPDKDAPVPPTSELIPESTEPVQDDDSEDEEPEDVTTSVATANLKATAASAREATAARERSEKKRRKEIAARLEQQSKKSKSIRKSKDLVSKSKGSPELAPVIFMSDTTKAGLKSSSIPALLPDDVLADEIPIHIPIQARRRHREPPSNTRMKFSEELGKVKDRLVGPVKVSVLSTLNTMLPPKSNGPSKNLKEQWLMGRRPGRKGASQVERRPINQGFIRS